MKFINLSAVLGICIFLMVATMITACEVSGQKQDRSTNAGKVAKSEQIRVYSVERGGYYHDRQR